MLLPVFLPVVLSFLPSFSESVQCVLNHEFTVDRYKDISMVKSTCFANKYCVHVHYEDKNKMKKQGYSVGCDKTDCNEIDMDKGWETNDDGHICKMHRDYGSAGQICCCTKDFCNGSTTLTASTVLVTLLLWVIA